MTPYWAYSVKYCQSHRRLSVSQNIIMDLNNVMTIDCFQFQLSITWGKKNPEIQYTAGAPVSIHVWMNLHLSSKSCTHDDKGLSDG